MVTIYKSSDPGAPILTGQPGSFVALLDALLVGVDGIAYGDKPSLGWTREFGTAAVAAWRMSTTEPGSSGAYLKVWNEGGGNSAFARGYKTMSSLNVGENETPTVAMTDRPTWSPSDQNNSAARGWILIGDGRTFYINILTNGTSWTNDSQCVILGFGDYDHFAPGHTHNFFVMNSYYIYNNYDIFESWSLNSPRREFALARDSSNIGGAVNGMLICPGGRSGSGTGPAHPNLYTGQIHTAPGIVADLHGYCGKMRGLHVMMSRPYYDWGRPIGPTNDAPEDLPFIQMISRHPSSGWVTAAVAIKQENW